MPPARTTGAHLLCATCLESPPEDFLRWWHSQDYRDWAMTDVTGNTDWAWLVLARAGQEVSESKFGGL